MLTFLELVQLPKLYQEYDGLHLAEKREIQHSIQSNNISCGIKAIQPNSIASKVALIVFPHIFFFCMLCVHDSLARGQGSGSGAGATVNVCMCLCGNVSEVSTEGGLETRKAHIYAAQKNGTPAFSRKPSSGWHFSTPSSRFFRFTHPILFRLGENQFGAKQY